MATRIKVSRTTTIIEVNLDIIRGEDIDAAPDVCDDLIQRIEALAELLGVPEEQAERLILGN